MAELDLEITSHLIESQLKTGSIQRHLVISKGLPEDAELKRACVNTCGNLELVFESEKTKEDKNIIIEVTTLSDV